MATPRITIVTPSFNHGRYLEKTIRSVLDQGYSNLEYMVIDGGSTDETVNICRKYDGYLSYWVSEPDRGQSHAINKGFARATGDILHWLCSDDLLAPGALATVADQFCANPSLDVLVGACRFEYLNEPHRNCVAECQQERLRLLPYVNPIYQPSCFFRRHLVSHREQPVDERYHFTMDYELWCFFGRHTDRWCVVPEVLSVYVVTGDNKSFNGGMRALAEFEQVYQTYRRDRVPLSLWLRHLYLPVAKRRRARGRSLSTVAAGCAWRAFEKALNASYGTEEVRGFRSYYQAYGVEQAS